MRSRSVIALIPRSLESVGNSGKGGYDSGANGFNLINYEVVPGSIFGLSKFGMRR